MDDRGLECKDQTGRGRGEEAKEGISGGTAKTKGHGWGVIWKLNTIEAS